MSYPKPLSEKRIEKMYVEAGISEKKREFLHDLFQAASNLYGIISLDNLWKVYKEYSEKTETVKISRKELLAFSSIARREENPYYIYEIDEIYSGEKRKDGDRMLIHNMIPYTSAAPLSFVYRLDEKQINHSYYVPENLLEFKDNIRTEEQKALLDYLKNKKVKNRTWTDRNGNEHKTKNYGRRLDQFSFYSESEKFEIEYYRGKKIYRRQLENYIKLREGAEAEKIFNLLLLQFNISIYSVNTMIELFFNEMNEVGVGFTYGEAQKAINIIIDASNSTYMWCNRGWRPDILVKKAIQQGEPMILEMGDDMKKLYENEPEAFDGIVRMGRERGIDIRLV